MTSTSRPEGGSVITLDAAQWQALLDSLYERDNMLDIRTPGARYHGEETVDAYTLSAYAEAFQSAEVDGDVWGTLEDIDETAATEEQAWQRITDFYLGRGCVLVRVSGLEEPEEWILAVEMAARVGLPVSGT